MVGFIIRALISGVMIASVAEVGTKYPRIGALMLSVPMISMGAFIMAWLHDRNLAGIAQLAKGTLSLAPFGLIFFVPLAFCDKLQIGFWFAMVLGVCSTLIVAMLWLWLWPSRA